MAPWGFAEVMQEEKWGLMIALVASECQSKRALISSGFLVIFGRICLCENYTGVVFVCMVHYRRVVDG